MMLLEFKKHLPLFSGDMMCRRMHSPTKKSNCIHLSLLYPVDMEQNYLDCDLDRNQNVDQENYVPCKHSIWIAISIIIIHML